MKEAPDHLLSCRSNDVICESYMFASPPPSPLPIVDNPTGATEECFTWHQLKSVSGETVVRETVKEGGRPGESQSHRWMDTQRCSLLLPGGLCECVCSCERVCDYHVIACNYVLGGCTLSSQCEPPSANKWALYKAGQGKGLYAGSARSFVNRSVVADKNNNNSARF